MNEIETILRNSFSKSTRDMIMMAPPGKDSISVLWAFHQVKQTLVYTNQEPGEEGLIGELSTLQKE